MTDRPAQRFGLANRGRIEKGYFADVTIFDADRVIDTATYDDPIQYPAESHTFWSTGRSPWIKSAAPGSWPATRSRSPPNRGPRRECQTRLSFVCVTNPPIGADGTRFRHPNVQAIRTLPFGASNQKRVRST